MSARSWHDRRGNISILAALILPATIGVAGLALEYGDGLLVKARMQHIADVAAYGGALAYSTTSSTPSLNAAVARLATLNGIASAAATPSLVNSPNGSGNQAVLVTVTGTVPLALSKVLQTASQISPASSAYVELKSSGTACVVALKAGGTGVALSGGSALSAPGCAVASNASVVVSSSMTTPVVIYNSSSAPTDDTKTHIHPPTGTPAVTYTKKATADPLSTNTGVTGATAHLGTVALLTSPSAPNPTTAANIDFAYSPSTLTQGGCTGTFSGSTWTVTCIGSGPFNFGKLTLHGGIIVNFSTGGSASATYNFSDNIDGSSGALLNFGPGTYNIKGGIIVGGGMTMSFGAGTFNIGRLSSNCNGTAGYSICNSGTLLTLGGPSTFVLAGGIYNGGGSILTLGTSTSGNTSPTTNSFNIGKANDGNSLFMGGGAKTTFADASATGDLFRMAGNLNVASGGGSCLVLSAAANHDINGNFSTAGGTYLGSGQYTVNGYVGLGTNGGGDVSCTVNGTSQTLGMYGIGVTFVAGGAQTVTCDSLASAFCIAAGYGHVTLTAPTASSPLGSSTAGLAVIGPQSSGNTAAAVFASGATNTQISGAFYFPYGQVDLSGAALLRDTVDTGACLELIGSQVTVKAGGATASTCTGLGGSTGTNLSLVQ
jgi:Flp pilus assembly protein TadG